MRKVSIIMGTPVVVEIPGLKSGRVIETIFDDLRTIDAQLSPYKPNSELSRFRRGELTTDEVSIGMKAVMKACLEAEQYTGGFFSARYGGDFDPSGYVKGWAIGEARLSLLQQGFDTFCIGAGGDVTAKSASSKIWRLGILNPRDKKSILGRIIKKNISVATSGSYERGHHIINPHTGRPAKDFISLTVAGPEIVKADIFATAAFAMGKEGLKFVDKQLDYEVLAVDRKGKILLSDGMMDMLEESNLTITGEVV